MAKGKQDDETGITPSAKDGEPNGDAEQAAADNEVETRRQMKEARQRQEEEATGMAGNGKRGRPIDDQDDGDESEPEMFPLGTLPGDPKTTWRNLIKAGTPVKLECALSRAAVPLTAGLHGYGEKGEVLVTFEAGTVKSVPELGDEDSSGKRKLKGVKLVQELRAVHVRAGEGMYSLGQVLDILESLGIPRSSDKVAEMFGPQTPEQRQAAAG